MYMYVLVLTLPRKFEMLPIKIRFLMNYQNLPKLKRKEFFISITYTCTYTCTCTCISTCVLMLHRKFELELFPNKIVFLQKSKLLKI